MSIYKNDKNLLTEVNRMKQIMGVQLINEGWDDIIKSILGISKDGGEKITLEISDDVKQLSPALSKIGGDSLSDVTSYLSKQGLYTDDDIINWIKTQPEIMDQMAKSSDQIMKQASNIVYEKLKLEQILTSDAIRSIDSILSRDISRLTVGEIDNVLRTLMDVYTKTPNSNVYDLIGQLEDQRLLVLTYKDNITKSSTQTSTSSAKGTENISSSIMDSIGPISDEYGNMVDPTAYIDNVLNMLESNKLLKLPKNLTKDLVKIEIDAALSKLYTNVKTKEDEFLKLTPSEQSIYVQSMVKNLGTVITNVKVKGNKGPAWYKDLLSMSLYEIDEFGKKSTKIKPIKAVTGIVKGIVLIGALLAVGCLIMDTYEAKQEGWGTWEGKDVIDCVTLTLTWIPESFKMLWSGTKDVLGVGQYSNDAEGWKEWIEDNTKELGIVDYGFDTTENKRYINLSNDDQKFVNYDTESETFITEN
jgi:hypothetical protein